MSSKLSVLVFDAYDRFRCIGPACEDFCCKNWAVQFDKPSYEHVQALPQSGLKNKILSSIVVNEPPQTDASFGLLKLSPATKHCELLASDGRCSVHAELGEEFLCYTCFAYPREQNLVFGILERTFQLSCPEACRVILLNPNGLSLSIREEEENRFRHYFRKNLVAGTVENPAPHLDNFWDIRVHLLQLLQNREQDIETRLYFLGAFTEMLTKIFAAHVHSAVPEVLARSLVLASTQKLSRGQACIRKQAELSLDLLGVLEHFKNISLRFDDCIGRCKAALGLVEGENRAEVRERFCEAYQKANDGPFATFQNQHAYVLENFLVNQVFLSTYPFAKPPLKFGEEFASLTLYYVLTKFGFLGIAAEKQTLTTEDAVFVVQAISKVLAHSEKLQNALLDFIKAQRLADFPNSLALLGSVQSNM